MPGERELIDEQIAYYRRRAAEYDATTTPPGDPFAAESEQIEAALEAFRPLGKVLELACGTGSWTRRLVLHASEITALDSSPEMIDLNRLKVNDPRVRYVVADIFSWSPDSAYDVVMFANWLSHVPPDRFDDFWALVERCLPPGGRVFFVDEAKDAWRNEERLSEEFLGPSGAHLVRRRLRDGSAHRVIKVFWDPAELQARLRGMGWQVAVAGTGSFYWGEGTPPNRPRRGAPESPEGGT